MLSMDTVIGRLKAVGEPSRLRLLRVLSAHELTVSEICRTVGQSQPRVSRHLKLLAEAGLLERHAEGSSAFFRLSRDHDARQLVELVLAQLDDDDIDIERDEQRLAEIRREHGELAEDYFSFIAGEWESVRALHVPETEIEAALLSELDGVEIAELLDLGTGTGRMLELLAHQIDHGLGIDASRDMLAIARAKLEAAALAHCQVRLGDMYELEMASNSVDVVVIHHVLHFLDDPERAIHEAARVLVPDGRMLIVDFAPHNLESLRTDYAHRRLGFADQTVEAWFAAAGLDRFRANPITGAGDESLAVTIWGGRRISRQPAEPTGNRSASSNPGANR